MAARAGLKLPQQIVTPDTADQFPLLDDADLLGGFRVVASTTARDAIPAGKLKTGAGVYCQAEKKGFRLVASGVWEDAPAILAMKPTLASLKAISAAEALPDSALILVTGISAFGDCPPFFVQWSASSAATGDDALVYRPSAGAAASGNGRFLRSTTSIARAFTSGDTTPSVANGSWFTTTGTSAITQFTNAYEGQRFVVERGGSDIVLTHNASLIDIIGGANLTLTASSPRAEFVYRGGVARQVGSAAGGGASTSAANTWTQPQRFNEPIALDLAVPSDFWSTSNAPLFTVGSVFGTQGSNGFGFAANGYRSTAQASHAISAAVVSAGSGYTNGDIVTVSGGTTLPTTGVATQLKLTVSGGVVTGASVYRPGYYTVSSEPGAAASVTGGTGTGLTVTLAYLQSFWRTNFINSQFGAGMVQVLPDGTVEIYAQSAHPSGAGAGLTRTASFKDGAGFLRNGGVDYPILTSQNAFQNQTVTKTQLATLTSAIGADVLFVVAGNIWRSVTGNYSATKNADSGQAVFVPFADDTTGALGGVIREEYRTRGIARPEWCGGGVLVADNKAAILAAALLSATVLFGAGTYTLDQLTLPSTVWLVGESQYNTTIKLKDSATYNGNRLHAVWLQGDNSAIKNIQVDQNRTGQNKTTWNTNNASAGYQAYAILFAKADGSKMYNPVVENVRIVNSIDMGVAFTNCDNPRAKGLRELNGGAGVRFDSCTDGMLDDFFFEDMDNSGFRIYPHMVDGLRSKNLRVTNGFVAGQSGSGTRTGTAYGNAGESLDDWITAFTFIDVDGLTVENVDGYNTGDGATPEVGWSFINVSNAVLKPKWRGGNSVACEFGGNIQNVLLTDYFFDGGLNAAGTAYRASANSSDVGPGIHIHNNGLSSDLTSRPERPAFGLRLGPGVVQRYRGEGVKMYDGRNVHITGLDSHANKVGIRFGAQDVNTSFAGSTVSNCSLTVIDSDFSDNELCGVQDFGGVNARFVHSRERRNGTAKGRTYRGGGSGPSVTAGYLVTPTTGAVATQLFGCVLEDDGGATVKGSVLSSAPRVLRLQDPRFGIGQTVTLAGCGSGGADLVAGIIDIVEDLRSILYLLDTDVLTFPTSAGAGTITTVGRTVTFNSSTDYATNIAGTAYITAAGQTKLVVALDAATGVGTLDSAFSSNLSGASFTYSAPTVTMRRVQDYGVRESGATGTLTNVLADYGAGNVVANVSTSGVTYNKADLADVLQVGLATSLGLSVLQASTFTAVQTAIYGGALGTAAGKNTGTSGAVVPLLNAANTFSANPTISVTGGAASLTISRDAAQTGTVTFQTGGANRFVFGVSNSAESGSNAGSDFFVNSYADAGTFLAQPFQIGRATGAATFSGDVNVGSTSGVLRVGGATVVDANRLIQNRVYTVATLPTGVQGKQVYASDLRVFNGAGTQEGAGSGTGGIVQYNGSAWKIAGTNVTAVA